MPIKLWPREKPKPKVERKPRGFVNRPSIRKRDFNYFGRNLEKHEIEAEEARLHGIAVEERDRILAEKGKAAKEEMPRRDEQTTKGHMRLLANQIELQEKSIAKIDDMIKKVKKSNPAWDAIKAFRDGFNPMRTIFKAEKSEHGKFYLISPWKLPINFIGIFFHKPGLWKLRKLKSIRSQMVETYERMTDAFENAESSKQGAPAFKISENELRIYARAGRLATLPKTPPKHDEGKEDKEEG